jgi:hypothetical protein
MSPVYEFHAFVIVRASDGAEAQRLAEKATEEVQLSNPDRARASLDDGSPTELEAEDF